MSLQLSHMPCESSVVPLGQLNLIRPSLCSSDVLPSTHVPYLLSVGLCAFAVPVLEIEALADIDVNYPLVVFRHGCC